jgi:hypothetical protein
MKTKIKYPIEYYIDIENGWYSIFNLDTGFCYAQFGSKEQAEKWIVNHTIPQEKKC